MPAYELYSSTPILLTPWLPNFASAEHIICSRDLMSPLLLQFLLVSGLIATVAPVFDINQIRVDINASAAQELVSRLRPKLLPPPKRIRSQYDLRRRKIQIRVLSAPFRTTGIKAVLHGECGQLLLRDCHLLVWFLRTLLHSGSWGLVLP
jgi:hypothetical protein